MLEKDKSSVFGLFMMKPAFSLNKDDLKRNYYKLSKECHPDMGSGDSSRIYELNKAYGLLQDDYARAKLFTKPAEKVSNEFPSKCLDLEDQIRANRSSSIGEYLEGKIEECKSKYEDPEKVAEWSYYRRLRNLLKGHD